MMEERNGSQHKIAVGHVDMQIKDSYSGTSNFCASGKPPKSGRHDEMQGKK
jgi:hypothetical protein